MRIKNLFDSLNAQQRSVPQLPAMAKARHISVLGAKTDPEHPFAGYMVGAGESAEPGKKRLGPDPKDPYEQGWRDQPDAANPYPAGTSDHAKWQDGHDEQAAQPHHYDESTGDKRSDTAPSKEFASNKHYVKFTPTGIEFYRKGELVHTRHGDYSNPTRGDYNTAKSITSKLWDKEYKKNVNEDDGMPDLEEVGEPVSSIMDAERRMAAGDRIFVAHEMDEEPFEIHNVGDLAGYTYDQILAVPQDLEEACWKGYHKEGNKELFGKRVPNCVKNEAAERNELDDPRVQAALKKMAERHKGENWSKEQLAALGKRIAARGQQPVKEDITKEDVISKLKAKLGDYLSDLSKEIKSDPDLMDKLAAKPAGDQVGPPVKTITTDDGHEIQIHGNEDDGFRISIKNKPAASKFGNLDEAVMACEMYCARRRARAQSADYADEA